jgi:glycosyltransferase involved in cell wall biosynthesis
MTDQISVLILTQNEEQNIEKCLISVSPLTRKIFAVDSGSTDDTVKILERYGATVLFNNWTTYSEQFNWGLEHIDFDTDWIMRLDADEEVTIELVDALKKKLPSLPPEVTGITVRRQVHFMGRWIRHGGYYPTWLLRVFRRGVGRCEALWMDEHIALDHGETIRLPHDIIDRNNKDLTFWTDKHNRYSNREARDMLAQSSSMEREGRQLAPALRQTQAQSRRWLKKNVYGRTPLFLRALLYFIYRYLIRFGFLDGKEGLIFHFLQGFWYRFLVDAKLYEHQRRGHSSESNEAP